MEFIEIITLVTFFLLLILIFVNFRDIRKHFAKVKLTTWVVVIAIFLVALYLRFAGPLLQVPLCDAQDGLFLRYTLGAKDLFETGDTWRFFQQPMGYPILLFLTFLISGASYASAIIFNVALSSLTIILVFLITYLITKNEYAGTFSALFLALFPMSVFFSQFGSTQTTSAFFVSLSVLFLLISLETRTLKMFLLTFVSLAFASNLRLENFMIFFSLFLICYAVHFHFDRKELKKLIIPIIVFLVLSSYTIDFIINGHRAFKISPEIASEYYSEIFSEKYLPDNLVYTFGNLSEPSYYPVFLYFFIFASLISIRRFPKLIVPLLWVILTLLFFGRFFGLKFASVHLYFIPLYPAFSILYGIGMVSILVFFVNKSKKLKSKGLKRIIVPVKIFLLVLMFLITLYPNIVILKDTRYGDEMCYTKDVYAAGDMLEGCVLVEKPGEVKGFNLKNVVEFILPEKNIVEDVEMCKDGYFLKIYDERFEIIFGPEKGIEEYVRDNCKLYNVTENLKAVDIYKIEC